MLKTFVSLVGITVYANRVAVWGVENLLETVQEFYGSDNPTGTFLLHPVLLDLWKLTFILIYYFDFFLLVY